MVKRKIVLETLKKAFKEYREVPFDWVISEVQAQSKVYNILYDIYKDSRISVQTSDIAYPELTEMVPVRLEYRAKDIKADNRRLDIAVLKDSNEVDLDLEKERTIQDTVDFFIEIKVAWGYSSGQFNGAGILKDLHLMSLYKNEGYMFYFIGNEYEKMNKTHQEGYKKLLDYHYKNYEINSDNIFIIFRDGVYKYSIDEKQLKKEENLGD